MPCDSRGRAHLDRAVVRERGHEVVVGQDRRRQAFRRTGDRGAQDRSQRVVGHPVAGTAGDRTSPRRSRRSTSSIIDRMACCRAAMSSGAVNSVALAKYSPAWLSLVATIAPKRSCRCLTNANVSPSPSSEAVDRVVQLRSDIVAGLAVPGFEQEREVVETGGPGVDPAAEQTREAIVRDLHLVAQPDDRLVEVTPERGADPAFRVREVDEEGVGREPLDVAGDRRRRAESCAARARGRLGPRSRRRGDRRRSGAGSRSRRASD